MHKDFNCRYQLTTRYSLSNSQLLLCLRLVGTAANASWSASATVVTRSVHWLPIRQAIQLKMRLLGIKATHSLLPPYLQHILSFHHPTKQLRSSSAHEFFKPAVNSNLASQAFSVSVPSVWNSLKPNLRSIDSSASFKSQLRITLFLSAYGST